MTDLISRTAAIDAIVFNSENRFAVDVLNDVPAVDAVPVAWFDAQIAKAPNSLWASLVRSVREVWQKEREGERRDEDAKL